MSNVAWANGGAAIFAGNPGTVTLSGTIVATALTFHSPGHILSSASLLGASGGLTIEAIASATIGSSLQGDGASPGTLKKTGPAMLTLSGALSAFTSIELAAGEIRFAGTASGSSTIPFSLADSPGVVMTLASSNGFNVGGLSGGGAAGGIVRPDQTAAIFTLRTNSPGGSFAGSLQDNGPGILALIVAGTGTQTLTAANPYSGPTTITAGTLAFSGGGSALNSPVTIAGGTLRLDNSATLLADRLSDTLPITVRGTLAFIGNSAAPASETLGALHFPTSRGNITLTPDPAQAATLLFESLAPRTAGEGGVLYFSGTNLGAAAGPGVAQVRFNTAPALVGGSGGEGSTTIGLVPGAFGTASFGTTFVTHGPNGIRPLAEAELAGSLATASPFENVSVATATDISSATAVNSLRLQAGGRLSGPGTLAVGTGMILAQSGSGPIAMGALDFGTRDGIVINDTDLLISSAILGGSATNGLTKRGAGRLTLAGGNSFTGDVNVQQGLLEISNSSALGAGPGSVRVERGAGLEIRGGSTVTGRPLVAFGSLGSTTVLRSLSGDNAWNGPASFDSSTLAVDSGSMTFGAVVSAQGRIGKTGSGTVVFGNGISGNFPDFEVFAGEIVSRAVAGTPFGGTILSLDGATARFAPSGSGADVNLTQGSATLTGAAFGYLEGNSTLILDRGANNSLTVTAGTVGAVFHRENRATMTLAPTHGLGALGTSERLKAGFGTTIISSGVVTPVIMGQDNDSNRSGDLLAYNAAAGFIRATYSASTNLQTAGATAAFHATGPQTLTANAAILALKNSGQTINLNGKTLTLGATISGSSVFPGGIILNGGTITSGTITTPSAGVSFASEVAIYTSLAGASIASNFTPQISATQDITKFGPGLLTLSGIITGGISINSGSVRLNGMATGSIALASDASLSGIGKSSGILGGGVISPGNGAGIFTAGRATSYALSISFGSFPPAFGPASRTAYAFEFTRTGAPVFNSPSASGNDLLRLTNPTTPIDPLSPSNEIHLYFNLATGVRVGDSFLGGFFTDKNAPFDTALANATWRVFLADPFGDTVFNDLRYTASSASVLADTVPQTADFGAGAVNGYISRVTIVPEPGVAAMLLIGSAMLFSGASRSRGKRKP